MRPFLIIVAVFLSVSSFAQKKKELVLDKDLKPTSASRDAIYYGVIEKKNDLWYRELYFIRNRGLASQAWFKDEDAMIPHNDYISFHYNRRLERTGRYVDGKREGVWLVYYPDANLRDSFIYKNGYLTGVQFRFYNDGNISDSMNFDGIGNGTQIGWHPEGTIFQAGFWTRDTVKKGRWKYYDISGKLKATEDFTDGKVTAMSCYDPNGNSVDTAICKTREASFPEDGKGWRGFLTRNLNASVPIDNGAKPGQYTVLVMFSVERDGTVSNISAFTKHGFGMEQEVLRLMKMSPRWQPALKFGIPFRAFKIQPVTFIVSEG